MIITVKLILLENEAKNRKPGYIEECKKIGKPTGDGVGLRFEANDYFSLRDKFNESKKSLSLTVNNNLKTDEKPLPSSTQIIGNFASAITRAGTAIVKGQEVLRPDDFKIQCESTCENCPSGWYLKAVKRCAHSACGCFTGQKTRLLTENCPLFFWPICDAQEVLRGWNLLQSRKSRYSQEDFTATEQRIRRAAEKWSIALPESK